MVCLTNCQVARNPPNFNLTFNQINCTIVLRTAPYQRHPRIIPGPSCRRFGHIASTMSFVLFVFHKTALPSPFVSFRFPQIYSKRPIRISKKSDRSAQAIRLFACLLTGNWMIMIIMRHAPGGQVKNSWTVLPFSLHG